MTRESGSAYEIVPGPWGPELVLRSPWSAEVERAMSQNGVVGLELNHAKSWPDRDVRFLRRVPWLRSLKIIDLRIDDVSSVHALHDLRRLQVSTYCKTKIDFGAFPHLERLNIEWRTGIDSLFGLPSLRHLFVNRLPAPKAERIGDLRGLTRLGVMSCGALRLDALRSLGDLRALRLGLFRRLEDNDFLRDLGSLRGLLVQSCGGFRSLEPLSGLYGLKSIALESVGSVDSLSPISRLQELESVGLYDRTEVADGRLSVLRALPALRSVATRDRPHYDLKAKDLPQGTFRAWDEGTDS